MSGTAERHADVGERLLRPIVFAPPELIDDSAWLEHIPFAFWLTEALRPRRLVELGTHAGVSYCAFLQAGRALGLDLVAAAVDTWEGDAHTGAHDPEVYRRLDRHHGARYVPNSRLLKMRFDAALDQFADASLDLIHIDGFHTYEAVRHDFEAWRPKLGRGGVALLHDTAERRDDFGVWRLWEELARDYPTFAFTHGHGLGLVLVGPEPPEAVRWLTGLSSGEAERVRAFFGAIGARYSAEIRERDLTRALDAQRLAWAEAGARAAAEHAAAVALIEAQAGVLDEQARVMADHAGQFQVRDAALTRQAALIAEQAALIARLRQDGASATNARSESGDGSTSA